MTLEEIQALRAPQQRPYGVTYTDYNRLCYTAGVAEPITKSDWESLPLMKGAPEDDKFDLEKMSMRPKGMSYKGYAEACKAAGCPAMSKGDFEALPVEDMEKADDEDAEADAESDEEEVEDSGPDAGEEDADDEEEEADVEVEKAMSTDSLMKAIEAYEDVEEAISTPADLPREAFLQARLDAGTISKSERTELGRIWAGSEESTPAPETTIQKSLLDTLHEDDNAGHLVDASDFLRTLVKGVDDRMSDVLGSINRDGRSTRELMKAQGSLIKSLAGHAARQDEIIKAMAERLETVESSPAPRRSVSSRREGVAPRQMQKSVFGGADDNLSKGQVTTGLRALLLHAVDNDDNAAVQRITHATALYEQSGNLPQNIMEAVRQVS